MFPRLFDSRISALVAWFLLLSFAIGMVDPWIRQDLPSVAINLVEEVELDAEEVLEEGFLEPVFHQTIQVWTLVSSWPVLISDRPRLGIGDSFFEPQSQRPPPRIDHCC